MEDMKSDGHKKLERVNRRLEMNLEQKSAELKLVRKLLQKLGEFHEISNSSKEKVLNLLSGVSEEQLANNNEISELRARASELSQFLENRKKQVEELKQYQRESFRNAASAKSAVEDAVAILWGGFSKLGVEKLQEIGMRPYISNQIRARACYELARFFADNEQYSVASNLLSDARALSKEFLRGTRPRVLEYEMLLETGDLEIAFRRVKEYIEYRPNDPDFKIAYANYFNKVDKSKEKINVISHLFMDNGMAPISIVDDEMQFLSLTTPDDLPHIADGPKVSVLMSSYNSADYLRLAVGSMQKQTWRNLEIIITDDCSSDNSLEILNTIAAEDPRVIILTNTETTGTYGNRNRMLNVCTGEFVTVHDSDDWSHPQMIEHQINDLLENPEIRLNTTLMCRVSLDLQFHLRPSRSSLEYCHMNYPGFMMRKGDITQLGGWDPIMANADAEFERRVKQVYGKDAFKIINQNVPYSFFLVHDQSLTQQKLMNLRSLSFGTRNEYHRQSEYWMEGRRAEAIETGELAKPFAVNGRTSRLDPFPSPNSLMIPALKQKVLEYDVLLISDLFLLGGTRSCNLNYIRILHSMGKKVALFNWPRADLRFSRDINPAYRELVGQGMVEIVTWEDTVYAKNVIIHHPPIANFELDKYPNIETEKVSVLVNQLPFQTVSRERTFYNPTLVTELIQRLFNPNHIEWIAITPLCKRYIEEYSESINIRNEIWYPPIYVEQSKITTSMKVRHARMKEIGPVFARHSRDHWTKWPNSAERTKRMYMTEADYEFNILGGDKSLKRRLEKLPLNWKVHPYDSISVPDLLNSSDIFLNFNNEIYIEEFGRNVMEAMVYGLPVITESVFAETFGDAVLIADESGPEFIVDKLLNNKSFFENQVAKGRRFVEENCEKRSVIVKLDKFLSE